jgi:hypothetical protein
LRLGRLVHLISVLEGLLGYSRVPAHRSVRTVSTKTVFGALPLDVHLEGDIRSAEIGWFPLRPSVSVLTHRLEGRLSRTYNYWALLTGGALLVLGPGAFGFGAATRDPITQLQHLEN